MNIKKYNNFIFDSSSIRNYCNFIMGVDAATSDRDIFSYTLFRVSDKSFEWLHTKEIKDYNLYLKEVSNYFNTQII